MKNFLLLLILTFSVNTVFAISSLEAQIAVDLYKADPIYTRTDAVEKINSLLRNKLNVTQSEVNRINLTNGPKFAKMAEYKENLAKYKSLILEEVFSRNPDEERLNLIYKYSRDTERRRSRLWLTIQESIWDIIGSSRTKPQKAIQNMSTLRW